MKIQILALAGFVSFGLGVVPGFGDPVAATGQSLGAAPETPFLGPPAEGTAISAPSTNSTESVQPVGATEPGRAHLNPGSSAQQRAVDAQPPVVKVITRKIVVVRQLPPKVVYVQGAPEEVQAAPRSPSPLPPVREVRPAPQPVSRLAFEIPRCAPFACNGHIFGVGF